MRRLTVAPLLAATLLISTASLADVGPPPKCGPGTHHVYHFGHHCVPDGTPDPDSDPAPIPKPSPDNAAATTTTPTAAPTFATPPPSPTAAPAPGPAVPAMPPADRGCACSVVETRGGAVGLLAGVAALAALLRRRRAR